MKISQADWLTLAQSNPLFAGFTSDELLRIHKEYDRPDFDWNPGAVKLWRDYFDKDPDGGKDFTFDNGLDVQYKQLLGWKNILKESMFERLQAQIDKENESTRCAIVPTDFNNGYEVFRGNDIDNWVANNLMCLNEEEPIQY